MRSSLVIGALMTLVAAKDGPVVRENRPAPQIDLRTIDGKRIQLSTLRGHPVVVVFWATWCGPCRGEFAELVKAHHSFGDNGLKVLAVNGRDQEDSLKDVQRFLSEFDVHFDVVLDVRGSARRAYGLRALPTTIFVDSSGVTRRVNLGAITPSELVEGIALIR